MNEDTLIAALAEIVAPARSRVLVGIGDDAAVWQPSRSNRSVVTTDALVEGVHFNADWMSWREIGARALESNLSDLAAMGARPVLATIALGVSAACERESLLELYRGIAASAARAGCTIAGGDVTRTPVVTLALTLIGEASPTRLKLRSGAKKGDAIVTTGKLGASRAGLCALRGELALEGEHRAWALQAYRAPIARLDEGRWLAASTYVHAMMDVSDGLSTDLIRMCARSGVGAVIDALPICDAARDAAHALGVTPEAFVLAGGEEYELLAAVDGRAYRHLAARFRARFGRELFKVGDFRTEGGIVLRGEDGLDTPVVRTGWDSLESQ
ncbi:MAG: thiamine-phosphate kinase [Candidatus Eremiobacteraeota bacterium]|nr:thiamine-phosphate kinase [Candidatus Eremiobacteraeota bacterium]